MSVGGRQEQLIQLELDVRDLSTQLEGELPAEGHFLVLQEGTTFRQLVTIGANTAGLGETGQVLAAVDLDGDGTDELVVEWRYDEGRWYRLLQLTSAGLLVLGEFGLGS